MIPPASDFALEVIGLRKAFGGLVVTHDISIAIRPGERRLIIGPNGAGNGPAKFPALRGQHSVYVTEQLTAYAAGTRPPGPGGIMPAIAKRLSADDIRDLSSYVQGLR